MPDQIAQGRKALGELMEGLSRGGIRTGKLRRTLPDGTVITASFDGTTPVLDVESAPPPALEPEAANANLWVPRGFVVYPAWHGRPFGVGLPIIAASGKDAQDSANLAPGLDITRWTAGGPCGEVLLSVDDTAGYPDAQQIPAPLLYEPDRGPVLLWAGRGNYDARAITEPWTAYRLELAPYVAHYAEESTANQRALLEAANLVRTGAGVTAATQRFRGFGRVAEIAASVMMTTGTIAATSPAYPEGYATPADRLTKDGYGADWVQTTAVSFTRADVFAAGEFRAIGGSPSAVVNGWATISGNPLGADLGPGVLADVGYRGGFNVLALTTRDRWIEAGNANWQGNDPTLPPISWHSFASLNLAWETYPANYDVAHYQTTPLAPLFNFTDSNGDCWLRYTRNATIASAYYDAAMGRHLYCRGRSIALAPNGGLIWGACVLPNGNADRLIALVHHPEDQPGDTQAEGFTRYLRVWWCDIPQREIRLAPQRVICGTDATDACSWRGGTLVDLGAMPPPSASGWAASTADKNSLKYASAWRFAPDGSRAVCLRDYGALADYQFLRGQAWSAGLQPRAVELTFSIGAVIDGQPAPLNVSVAFHDFTDGVTQPDRLMANTTPLDSTEVFGSALYETGAVPIAVDYTINNALVYAYSSQIVSHQQQVYSPTDGSAGFSRPIQYLYVGTGDAGVQYASDLGNRVLQGAGFQTPAIHRMGELALALDVASATFALKLTRPRFLLNLQGDPSLPAPPLLGLVPGLPCQTFTSAAVNGVQLVRGGAVLAEDWYAAPDGALFTVNDPCYVTSADVTALVYLPLSVSANVQGFYAERFGEHLYGYQCAPMPNAVPTLASVPSGSPCGCTYTIEDLNGSALLTAAQQAPRGGRAVSSVPLPDHDWLIFGKVV